MVTEESEQTGAQNYAEASPFYRLLKTETRVKLVDVFLRKHYRELTESDLATFADVNQSTVNRNIRPLVNVGFIEQTGRDKNGRHYRLNKNNSFAKALGKAQSELRSDNEEVNFSTEDDAKDMPDDTNEMTSVRGDRGQTAAAKNIQENVPQLQKEASNV